MRPAESPVSLPPMRAMCPACGAASDGRVAFTADVPVLLNVLVDDRESARAVPMAHLALTACVHCGFVWNAAFDAVPYDDTYLVDPTRSARYRRHLDAMSDRVVTLATSMDADEVRIGIGVGVGVGIDVAEIGCGQGHFVAHLAGRHPARLGRVLGFDPAFRPGEVELPPNAAVHPIRFEADVTVDSEFTPCVVVARHLIEHLADPLSFLVSIRETFGARGPFALFLETPNVAHTLNAGLLHDFCFEHCSMFSPDAMRACLARAGFTSIDVDPNVFDGEYLVATAVHDPAAPRLASSADAHIASSAHAAAFDDLARLGRRFAERHRAQLRASLAHGPAVLWGGAGKGALFAWLVDPDGELLSGVVDLHEAKQGHFLPGAGHRVLAPADALALGARTILVSNPTYVAEVRALCDAMGLGADVRTTERAPE